MNTRHPPPPFDRLAFFDGAELARTDLRDAVGYEARMLDIHVRAMHDTWGIAIGLDVTVASDAKSISVASGAAYTCRGEALIVAATTSVAAPAAIQDVTQPTFDLVLRAAGVGDARPCERIAACDGDALELPPTELAWVLARTTKGGPHLGDVRLGEDIPLARFVRNANGTLTGPDFAERRHVRPARRPFMASGVTSPGALEWKRIGAELVATVDTSSAGFGVTPAYVVSLGDVPSATGRIGPWLHVDNATSGTFTARLIAVVPGQKAIDTLEPLESDLAAVSLTWLGVEFPGDCSDESSGDDT